MFEITDRLKGKKIYLELEKAVPGDAEKNWAPAYFFHICAPDGTRMGGCDLRIGHNENLYYGGNIGYHILPEYRGHHYAAQACRLLFQLARRHHLEYVIITCNPDNLPSRKTCESLGGTLEEIADLPCYNDMYQNGERQKCIFRFDL